MRWRQAAVIAATALMPVAAQEPKPAGPTPAAIIEKHLAAIGGRDALREVKTMVVRGRNASLGVADRPLVRYLKHPNLLRQQDAPGATTFIVSDGAKAFQVGASGRVEVTQAWASPLRHTTIDDGFLDDGKLGIRYEYLGSEGIKTGPWKFHHLRRVFPDGYAEDLYFEADSGLLRMRVEDNGRAKRVFYDYRDVGAVRYPFVTATVFDGLEPPHLFIVDEVTLNIALDDGFFLKTGGLELPPGGALVWYLGHCGYAVRTANHLLIFDYQERRDGQQPKTRPGHPSLASGWIDPREIRDLKVRVFVSHAHEDHYDPVISTWRAAVPDIAYYFGWKAAEGPADHYLVGPRAEIRSGGIEIATINSHHAGVPEVAWLVKVDGLVIYHNGDCQPDDPRAEYGYLRTKTESIDLAFVPPVYEDGQKYTLQNADLFTRFRVRAAFPMHFQADDARYHDFQKAAQARFPEVPVRVPTVMGQRFVYAKGR